MKETQKSEQKMGFIARYAKITTVIAVVFGATSGVLGSLTAATSMAIGFWRLAIALPFFIIPVAVNADKRAKLKAITKKDYGWCFVSGAFLFGHFFSWFNAVKLTNIASASVLAALHPLVVLLVTVFIYHKKVGFKSVGAGAESFADGSLSGDIFAFLAAIFMGLYFSVGDSVRKRVDGGLYVLLVFSSCWICFAIGSIVTDTKLLGYEPMDYVYIAVMAVMCQIGAHAVFNLCIGHVSSLYVSTWEAGEPVFATLMAVVFLRQVPFDLLVYLIENAQMSIYDIEIKSITSQYLEYIKAMQEMDVAVATEFMVLASSLIEIKSKMILPRINKSGESIIEEDPRTELVSRLLEYKKFKKAADVLRQQEEKEAGIFEKPKEDISQYLDNPDEYLNLDLKQFASAFSSFLEKKQRIEAVRKQYTKVRRDRATTENRIAYIAERIRAKIGKIFNFRDLIPDKKDKYDTVVTFVSILEMAKQRVIKVEQKTMYGDIEVESGERINEGDIKYEQ